MEKKPSYELHNPVEQEIELMEKTRALFKKGFYTEFVIRTFLKVKGYSPEEIDETIEEWRK